MSQWETDIAKSLAAQDMERVAVLTLEAYGSEILGFLMAQLRRDQDAEEVFAVFAEDLWRSLSAGSEGTPEDDTSPFALRSSMRAYAYALARNAMRRFLDRDVRKQKRHVPLSQVEEMSRILDAARTGTPTFARTDAKHRLADLRERLSADEQALLTLRVDRGLEWREIAEVLDEDDDLPKAAARQRKRFQLLKDKLASWAREEGLLGDE